jgi:hypothetical protein
MFDTIKKIFGNSVVEIENPNPKIDYYGMGNQLRKHLHKHLDTRFEEWKSGVEIPLSVDDTDVVIYQSGLNIRSFIPATSPLATKTLELWEMESNMNELEEELNKMRKNFETKKQKVRNYITEVVDFYKK